MCTVAEPSHEWWCWPLLLSGLVTSILTTLIIKLGVLNLPIPTPIFVARTAKPTNYLLRICPNVLKEE